MRESKEARRSLTRVRSAINLKAQSSTVSLRPRAYLQNFIFLWKKSRYRTTAFTWNSFLALKAKAKVGRWRCILDNTPLCVIPQLHPPLSLLPKYKLQSKDLSILTTSDHSFCLKSGLTEYSALPQPQTFLNLLLHRKSYSLKPPC